jgi:hypothetical protein
MNRSTPNTSQQEALDRLTKLDSWTEQPLLARNAIPGTPETLQRFGEIAAEQGVTTEEILLRALAALEAQSIR